MIDAALLDALAAVLRTGSFDGAARALNVTPSAISQRIRAFEERMGCALVVRSQPVRPTEAGARLARHAEDVRLLEQALAADLGFGLERGARLKIAVNADSLATWILPALAALPDLLFDLEIDDQDHSADWLRRGAVVAAVTAGGAPVPGCDAEPLGALRYLPTASPGFVARWFAGGVDAASLARAPALRFNAKDRLQEDWAERLTGARPALPFHQIGSSTAFVEAARLGIGWGLNPEALVTDDLAAGRLVALGPALDVALAWQVNRRMAGALGPLTRAVRAAARAVLVRA
jgi:LysR family transcriptional regulator, chromosome initiation inhibitor